MEVAYAIIASAASMEPDGRLFLLNGGLEDINLVFGPQLHTTPLYLAGKITFPPEECGQEHVVQIELLAPDGGVIERPAPTRVTPLSPEPPSRTGKIAFLLEFVAIPFRESGRYTFRISVDSRPLSEVDFNVTITPPMAEKA